MTTDKKKLSSKKVDDLQSVMNAIEKQFGKGTIMRLSENQEMGVEMLPTGSLALDIALGGGLPISRITEIYGPESSGKTTIALLIIANAQRYGKKCAFIKVQHALDRRFARQLGVNTDGLIVSQPNTREQALKIIDDLVRSGAVSIIVVDSMAALTSRLKIENEIGNSYRGSYNRLINQAMRKLKSSINNSQSSVLFINLEDTTDSSLIKLHASVRMGVHRIKDVKITNDRNNRMAIDSKICIEVVKNKIAPPFRQIKLQLLYGQGISRTAELLDLAVAAKIINKEDNACYNYMGKRLGQGRENTLTLLKEHPDLCADIEVKVRSYYLSD